MNIDFLVCVVSRGDLDVWRVTHTHILKNIKANTYQVFVPPADVSEFQRGTDSRFQVKSEEDILEGRDLAYVKSRLAESKKYRAGWYLQQFVKISAVRQGNSSSINLIWDADNLPTKPLEFVENGRIKVYRARKFHQPYFDTIQRLTGETRSVDYSFVTQCLATKKIWVDALCARIEKHTGLPWIEAVLSNLDGVDSSEFSEYETLGTFISNNYAGEYCSSNSRWDSMGYSLYGKPENLDTEKLREISRKFDFVAFEKWDKDKKWSSRFARRIKAGCWKEAFFSI